MPAFTVPAGWIVAQLPDGSELVAFATPALNALPSMASDGHAAMSDGAATGGAGANGALPPVAGLEIAHAAQWLGLVPQDGNPVLRQWAAQAGLGSPSGVPADGDAARIAPGTTMSDDPARVGASPLDAPSGDPANTQHPNPEFN